MAADLMVAAHRTRMETEMDIQVRAAVADIGGAEAALAAEALFYMTLLIWHRMS